MSVLRILEQIGRPRLLVLGDLMLDRYTWGRTRRVSPEAPVVVLEADTWEVRPGGAGSVVAYARGLDAEVFVAGAVGPDAEGRVLQRILAESEANLDLLITDPHRSTTVKERFLSNDPGRNAHQVFRVDREQPSALTVDIEDQLLDRLLNRLSHFDAILISDYGKGVCTPRLLAEVIRSARTRQLPVLVDPARTTPFGQYCGASLVKPNRYEWELLTGIQSRTYQDVVLPSRSLCEQYSWDAIIVTLDREGLVLVDRSGSVEFVPSQLREVCDVTGAGDATLATLGVCAGSQILWKEAATLANFVAGLSVERSGTVPITIHDIRQSLMPARVRSTAAKQQSLADVVQLLSRERQAGRRIVLTNGCFDLLHAGHVTCLQAAAERGDILVVAVNSDDSVRRLKGPTRPVVAENQRIQMLAALECVDYVVVYDDETPHDVISRVRPDVLVKGGTTPNIVGRELVEAYGGIVTSTGITPNVSTTTLINSIRQTPTLIPTVGLPGTEKTFPRKAPLVVSEMPDSPSPVSDRDLPAKNSTISAGEFASGLASPSPA